MIRMRKTRQQFKNTEISDRDDARPSWWSSRDWDGKRELSTRGAQINYPRSQRSLEWMRGLSIETLRSDADAEDSLSPDWARGLAERNTQKEGEKKGYTSTLWAMLIRVQCTVESECVHEENARKIWDKFRDQSFGCNYVFPLDFECTPLQDSPLFVFLIIEGILIMEDNGKHPKQCKIYIYASTC